MDTAMASERLTSNEDSKVSKLDFEMAHQSRSRKSWRISLNRVQVLGILLCFTIIVVLVGLMCFFEARRQFHKHDQESFAVASQPNNAGVKITPTTLSATTSISSESWYGDESSSMYESADEDQSGGRLPLDVIPESYDVHIQPFINEEDVEGTDSEPFTFDGNVVIRVRCDVATDRIVLHLDKDFLQLGNVSLIDAWTNDGYRELYESHSLDERHSFLQINLTKKLEPGGVYNLSLSYVGHFRDDDLVGFYRSAYEADDGSEVWVASTQMEPVSARTVLPCFDEPAMKAVFNVRITHRTNMTALSNGRETGTVDHGNGWSTTSYESTPIMSTYLLTFAVGVFDYTETTTASGTRLRVWTRPNAVETTVFALHAASAILTHFEEYFGSTYRAQMPKLDLIAVPRFQAGAMENWGLVIFPERNLLYNETSGTVDDKDGVLTITAHELAHQWFGNLVTMEWWDDIWLNEGFATYFGFVGANVVDTEVDMLETMMVSTGLPVLKYDLIPQSHPIRMPVSTPDEISGLFDPISYTKGGAVLRMMHHIIGEEAFRTGLQHYLDTFQYGNAVTPDLWDALTEADESGGHHNITHLMDTWTLQMGYPVLNLSRVNRTTVEARQEPFLAIGKVLDDTSPFGYTWYVVLSYTDNQRRDYENPDTISILDKSTYEFSLGHDVTDDDWYLANINAYGYFVVDYDVDNWFLLTQQLKSDHEVIPVLSRSKLLDDSSKLGLNGHISIGITLSLASYLKKEFNFGPWETILTACVTFRDKFGGTSGQGAFERYLRDLTRAQYHQLGFRSSNITSSGLERSRDFLLSMACKSGNIECKNDAQSIFGDFMASFNVTNPSHDSMKQYLDDDDRDVLLCTAIRAGTSVEWDYAWSLYTFPNASAEFTREWLEALTCAQQPWQIQKLLDYILDKEVERDMNFAVANLATNPVGRFQTWKFIRENWVAITERYPENFLYRFGHFIQFFNTELEIKEVLSFIESQDLGEMKDYITSAAERLKTDFEEFAEIRREAETWFEAYPRTE